MSPRPRLSILLPAPACLLLLAAPSHAQNPAKVKGPAHLSIPTGQSNRNGRATVGSLKKLIADHPDRLKKAPACTPCTASGDATHRRYNARACLDAGYWAEPKIIPLPEPDAPHAVNGTHDHWVRFTPQIEKANAAHPDSQWERDRHKRRQRKKASGRMTFSLGY